MVKAVWHRVTMCHRYDDSKILINIFKKHLQTWNKQTQYLVCVGAFSSRMTIKAQASL